MRIIGYLLFGFLSLLFILLNPGAAPSLPWWSRR
jgi:hypothetical protein